jgi:arylsulfatase
MGYEQWWIEHLFIFVPAQQFVGQFIGTFKDFPPSQKPGSFNLDQVLQSLQSAPKAGNN